MSAGLSFSKGVCACMQLGIRVSVRVHACWYVCA